jgi:hypothetical protein
MKRRRECGYLWLKFDMIANGYPGIDSNRFAIPMLIMKKLTGDFARRLFRKMYITNEFPDRETTAAKQVISFIVVIHTELVNIIKIEIITCVDIHCN